MRKIRTTVPMSETATDPRQPSRLEKKANIVVLSSPFAVEAAVRNSGLEKFVSGVSLTQSEGNSP
jgi:hypothetical protein